MYVYVLDYCTNAIYEIKLDNVDLENDDIENDDIEKILDDYDLDIDTCDYMYSEKKLEIETINKQ